MSIHQHTARRVLKDVKLFRLKQRNLLEVNERAKQQQYRELQEILSPFWAWRGLGR